jgi:hypothetical protein
MSLWSDPVPAVTVTVGATGAGAGVVVVGATVVGVGVGAGIGGGAGGAVFVTTGADARACARPWIVPEPGYEEAVFFGAGGTSEYVCRTMGTWVAGALVLVEPGRLTVRCAPARRTCPGEPPARTTRRVLGAADAEPVELAGGAWTAPGETRLGTWRTGNRATGTTTSGTGTATLGGSTIALMEAVNRVA